MVKIDPQLYKLVTKMAKKQHKNISKKKITIFYHQLYKLIKFSKIFTQNCNNNFVFIQDINASLLTLGIKPLKHQLGGYQNIFNGMCNKEMDECYLTQTAGNVYDGYCAGEETQCKISQIGGNINYDGYCAEETSQCSYQQGGTYDGYCAEETSQCSYQQGGTYDGYCGGEKTQCVTAIGGKKTKKNKHKHRPSKRLKDYTDKCLFEKDDFNSVSIQFSKLYPQAEVKFTNNSLYYLNAVSKYILEQIVKS
jgi:hypothetical protein